MSHRDRCAEVLFDEHRRVSSQLIKLRSIVESGDTALAAHVLRSIAGMLGPHFRYEEEALFPALVSIGERERVEHMLARHDEAIAAVEGLVVLTFAPRLGAEDVSRAKRWIAELLLDIADCDGVATATDGLSEDAAREVLERRDHALHAHLGLIEWATWLRHRPHAGM